MAELQQILARRRSSADQHVYQGALPSGGRKSRQEQEVLAFRSGWSSTPGCAGRNSFDIFTPRVSLTTIGDDDNRQGGIGHDENISDVESEADLIKSCNFDGSMMQRSLEVANAERDAANLDAANARGELAKAQEEIAQLRESLRRMSSSTDVLLGVLHDQQLELSKQSPVVEAQSIDASPLIAAAMGVFDRLDLDHDGQLSPDDVQVFAELMTPPKAKQGPEVLRQKIWQQLGMKEFGSMGRSEWLRLIQAKSTDSSLGKELTILDLERLISSLEALEAAGMRHY